MRKIFLIYLYLIILSSCNNDEVIDVSESIESDKLELNYWLFEDSKDLGATIQVDTLEDFSSVAFSPSLIVSKNILNAKLDSVNDYFDGSKIVEFDIDSNQFLLISKKTFLGPDREYIFYNLFVTNFRSSQGVYSPDLGLIMTFSAQFYRYLIMTRIQDDGLVEEINYNWYVDELFDKEFLKLDFKCF